MKSGRYQTNRSNLSAQFVVRLTELWRNAPGHCGSVTAEGTEGHVTKRGETAGVRTPRPIFEYTMLAASCLTPGSRKKETFCLRGRTRLLWNMTTGLSCGLNRRHQARVQAGIPVVPVSGRSPAIRLEMAPTADPVRRSEWVKKPK